jgi:hypothetical protein
MVRTILVCACLTFSTLITAAATAVATAAVATAAEDQAKLAKNMSSFRVTDKNGANITLQKTDFIEPIIIRQKKGGSFLVDSTKGPVWINRINLDMAASTKTKCVEMAGQAQVDKRRTSGAQSCEP